MSEKTEEQLALDVQYFDQRFGHLLPPTETDGMRGRLVTPRLAKNFALAGNAHFTVRSKGRGTRFTYRVNAPRNSTEMEREARKLRPIWFVAVLTGQDNDTAYKYIGVIRDTLEFHWGEKSKIAKSAPSVQAFYWFWNQAVRPEEVLRYDQVEVWHEGRCGMCGRRLTVPESVTSGYGPECVRRVQR